MLTARNLLPPAILASIKRSLRVKTRLKRPTLLFTTPSLTAISITSKAGQQAGGGVVMGANGVASLMGGKGRVEAVRDEKGRFKPDPNNPKSPNKFSDADRRREWKRLANDPNSSLTSERVRLPLNVTYYKKQSHGHTNQ